ncbi:MAG: pilus assembly protein TadG [Burkholderiales bacterium]|nr:pilus assembly protein TadG [Burkholderiales bacterium]MDE2608583.1 pilus assembly protein TadG [Burkholderiales bacterium]
MRAPRPRNPASRLAGRRRQGGAVAIVVGLTLAVLIGFAGLSLDLGKLYIAKTELSNAADACALAAARDLTTAQPLATAEAAGITTGTSNRVLFQSEAVSMLPDDNVTFSESFTGPYQTKGNFTTADLPKIKYVRCSASRPNITNWFIQVLDAALGSSSVSSTAVASTTQSQTTCALPVGICQAPSSAPYTVGQWVASKVGSNNQLTGNFMWVAYPDNPTVPDMRALLTGAGECNLPTLGTEVGKTGNIQSLANAWNTRFGIYQNPYSPPPDPTGVPDSTGYAYSPVTPGPQSNAYSDFVTRRLQHAQYQGNSVTGLSVQAGANAPPASYYSSGTDRRLALVPVISCPSLVNNQKAPVQSWACVLMLHPMEKNINGALNGTVYLEYRGDASDPSSPCATQGIPGSNTAGIGPLVPVLVQ